MNKFKYLLLAAVVLFLAACQTQEEVVPAAPTNEAAIFPGGGSGLGNCLGGLSLQSVWQAANALDARWTDQLCLAGASGTRFESFFDISDFLYYDTQNNYFDLDCLEDKAMDLALANANSGPGWQETIRTINYEAGTVTCIGCEAYYIYIEVTYQVCALPCFNCDPPIEEF